MILSKLKLKGSLMAGFAVPVFLCLTLVALVYRTANEVANVFQEVERIQNVTTSVDHIALSGERMVRSFRGYLVVQNPSFIEEYNTALADFRSSVNSAEKLIKNPARRNDLNQVNSQVQKFDAFAQQIINLVQKGKKQEAIRLFNLKTSKTFVDEFSRFSEELSNGEKDLLKEITLETEKSLNELFYLLILGSLILMIVSITLAIFIIVGVTQKINYAIQTIASSSTEIVATMQNQEKTATQQATSVNQTTVTMNELEASAQATADKAESAAIAAKMALEKSEAGLDAVANTLAGMALLKEKVKAISQQIFRLTEQTAQISNITRLVGNLANQTNMLALNAAVEAVRAKEQGRGFTVVATEIRKLADESQKSAQKINSLVLDIQTAITATVVVTDAGMETVESGVKTAQETTHALEGVREAVNHLVINNQQILKTSQEQAFAIEQVVLSMNTINQGAIQTVSGLAQVKTGLQDLNEVSLGLKTIV